MFSPVDGAFDYFVLFALIRKKTGLVLYSSGSQIWHLWNGQKIHNFTFCHKDKNYNRFLVYIEKSRPINNVNLDQNLFFCQKINQE